MSGRKLHASLRAGEDHQAQKQEIERADGQALNLRVLMTLQRSALAEARFYSSFSGGGAGDQGDDRGHGGGGEDRDRSPAELAGLDPDRHTAHDWSDTADEVAGDVAGTQTLSELEQRDAAADLDQCDEDVGSASPSLPGDRLSP